MVSKPERLTMTIGEFAEATGCSRNLAFRLARADKLPVPVIRLGEKRMCVSRRAVLALIEGKKRRMADLDALIPEPFSSDQQYARFYHLNLSELGDIELTDELHYLWPLLWGLPPEHWLRERVKALEAEISRRRGRQPR